MADKPILFSGPMVRSILDGRKSMTRRVIKPQPNNGHIFHFDHIADRRAIFRNPHTGYRQDIRIPIVVGDRLYIREAWRTLHKFDCLKPSHLPDDRSKITYEADPEHKNPLWAFGRLRRGMFLPRWASRLTLTVTDVKVERVQDISYEDTKAEGWPDPSAMQEHYPADVHRDAARDWFMDLWDSLNNKRGHGWDTNSWVAAYTFQTHRCNIDQMAEAIDAA